MAIQPSSVSDRNKIQSGRSAASDDSLPLEPRTIKQFMLDYYKPFAVVMALAILLGVSYYIYSGYALENTKLAVSKLRAADSIEKLDDPELETMVKGTDLEFEWRLKRLEKLIIYRKTGAKSPDYEGFIKEGEEFIEMYPRRRAVPDVMFNVATMYAFLGNLDKAKEIYQKVVDHPLAGYVKTRAEQELELLKNPKGKIDLDERLIDAYAAYAKERLATPTPAPSPSPVATPAVPPVSPVPAITPTPVPGEATPAPAASATPIPLDPADKPAEPEKPAEPVAPAENPGN